MFASLLRAHGHTVPQYLTIRQRVFERFLQHVSAGTVAVLMLVAIALLSSVRGNAQQERSGRTVTSEAKNVGNKCAVTR